MKAALWALLIIYACARILQIFPQMMPMPAIVALHVVPPALFALIHGAKCYGWFGSSLFVIVCLAVGSLFESISLRTGFPFGHYYFTEVMGPKIAGLPILLALAYVGMAYLAWTLSRAILGTGLNATTLPLLSAWLMVAWDFSMEPVWATIVRAWIWTGGGAYFGVPISNFIGWFLMSRFFT